MKLNLGIMRSLLSLLHCFRAIFVLWLPCAEKVSLSSSMPCDLQFQPRPLRQHYHQCCEINILIQAFPNLLAWSAFAAVRTRDHSLRKTLPLNIILRLRLPPQCPGNIVRYQFLGGRFDVEDNLFECAPVWSQPVLWVHLITPLAVPCSPSIFKQSRL